MKKDNFPQTVKSIYEYFLAAAYLPIIIALIVLALMMFALIRNIYDLVNNGDLRAFSQISTIVQMLFSALLTMIFSLPLLLVCIGIKRKNLWVFRVLRWLSNNQYIYTTLWPRKAILSPEFADWFNNKD